MAETDQEPGAVPAESGVPAGSTATTGRAEGRPPAGRRRLLPVLMLLGGLAIGFVGALLITERGPFAPAGTAVEPIDAVEDDSAIDPAPADVEPGDAASGREAVEGFVAAEIDGDFTRSYGYLSAAGRDEFRSAGRWQAVHADVLPPITGFEPGEVRPTDTGVEVTGTLRLEPGLDEVVGLVPGVADARWLAVQDDDGTWGVDLDASTFEPRYPADDDGAAAAAAAWVRARQRCEQAAEYGDGLVGVTGVADELCNATGAVEVGTPRTLEDVDAGPFLAAFGDDATTWARVVDVTSPRDLRVVLAPVGDEWLVVGLLSATAR